MSAGSSAGIFAMPPTRRTTSSIVTSGRTMPGVLRAAQQRLAGGVEHRPAAGEDRLALGVGDGEQLVGERLLRRDVADEALQPGGQRLPGLELGELLGAARQRLDLVHVDRLHEVGARGEVPVQRADADAGAAGDVLERGRAVGLGERLACGGDQLLVVAQRVGALRALRELDGVRSASWSSDRALDKAEGTSAIVSTGTGGTLRNRWRQPPVQSVAPPTAKGPFCFAPPSRGGHATRCPHPTLPHARTRPSSSG